MGSSCRNSYTENVKKYEPKADTIDVLKNMLTIVNNKVDSILNKNDPVVSNDRTVFFPTMKTSSRNEEYELKLLVDITKFDISQPGVEKVQGYVSTFDNAFSQVRVSIRDDRDYGLLTLKTKREGNHRTEFQYRIPKEDALAMIDLCQYKITKKRIDCIYKGCNYTVDVFHGDNEGLVMAEIEFANEEDYQRYKAMGVQPSWVKADVTLNEQYYNHNLAKNPYKNWFN